MVFLGSTVNSTMAAVGIQLLDLLTFNCEQHGSLPPELAVYISVSAEQIGTAWSPLTLYAGRFSHTSYWLNVVRSNCDLHK